MLNIIISRTKTPGGWVYGVYSAELSKISEGVTRLLTEPDLKRDLVAGVGYSNVALSDKGGIKGTSGSLARFNCQPKVVLSRLVDKSGTTVGFRVCSSDGKLARYRVSDITRYCERRESLKLIPFQNAQYVSEPTDGSGTHIRSYPNAPFPVEIIRAVVNRHSVQQKKSGVELSAVTLDTLSASMGSLYTKEQLEELRLGAASGVNISLYANPDISAEKMRLLRRAMELGHDVRVIANPEYIIPCSHDSLAYVIAIAATGFDVRSLLNPAYTQFQLGEIHIGLIKFLDVNQFSDPKLSPKEMSKIRTRLDAEMWGSREDWNE